MKTFATLVLLSLAFSAVLAQTSNQTSSNDTVTTRVCFGRESEAFDFWCDANCNNAEDAFCPQTICACGNETRPANQTVPVCRSVPGALSVPDSWCQTMCTFTPPFCPPDYCTCSTNFTLPDVVTATVDAHDASCCLDDLRYVFFSEANNVHRIRVDTVDPIVELCYSFPGGEPNALAVDSDGNIYVADPVAGVVTRIAADCNSTRTLISWFTDDTIDAPTSIAIAEGGLFVGGRNGLFFITLSDSGDVISIENTFTTIYQVASISVSPDGSVYFVSRDAEIFIYDPVTGETTQFLSVGQNEIPDIKGITVNDCGVHISATDSNQVYKCDDLFNGTSCRRYCEQNMYQDGFSCHDIGNPWQMASGCCCDMYVANAYSGNIVFYPNDGLLLDEYNPGQHGIVLAFNYSSPKAIAFYSPRNPNADANCVEVCNPNTPPEAEYCVKSDDQNDPTLISGPNDITVFIRSDSPVSEPLVSCLGIDFDVSSCNVLADESVLQFDGSSTTSVDIEESYGPDFSFSACIVPDLTLQTGALIENAPAGGTPCFSVLIDLVGGSSLTIGSGDGNGAPDFQQVSCAGVNFSDGLEHLVAVTVQGSTVTVFADNTVCGTITAPIQTCSNATTLLGGSQSAPLFYRGAARSVTIYDTSLTSSEVAMLDCSTPTVVGDTCYIARHSLTEAEAQARAGEDLTCEVTDYENGREISGENAVQVNEDECHVQIRASPTPSPTVSASPIPSTTPSVSSSAAASPSSTSSASASAAMSPSPSTAPSSSPSVSPSPSTSPSLRVTGRLVPGINLQASGGVTLASFIVGTASILFIKCPPGAAPNAIECPFDPTSSYFVPISQLVVRDLETAPQPFRVEMIPSFIQAVSKPGNNFFGSFSDVCMFHVAGIYNNGTTSKDCGAGCFATQAGKARGFFDCDNSMDIPASEARGRTRAGVTQAAAALGSPFVATSANTPAANFQTATTTLCAGDVVAEFSISLIHFTAVAPVQMSILSQPRFDMAQRCDASLTQAPRVCYDTNLAPEIHGVIEGDDGYVCVSDFTIAPGGESINGFSAGDPNLQPVVGDIFDPSFSVSCRSSGCPLGYPSELCDPSNNRICHINECP